MPKRRTQGRESEVLYRSLELRGSAASAALLSAVAMKVRLPSAVRLINCRQNGAKN